MELSNKEWKLGFGTGGNPRIRSIPARDMIALSKEIAMAKLKLGLLQDAKVVSCYEAGREGFWIHRCLTGKEIGNIVVDSSSIEVNRRKRRAKTDKVDVQKLYRQLIRHERGEKGVWSVVRVPSVTDEDERRMHRERGRLQQEITAHSNRIRSLLILHGIEMEVGRHFVKDLEGCKPLDGTSLGPGLKSELLREYERWSLGTRQLKEIDKERTERIKAARKSVKESLKQVEGETRLSKAPKELDKASQVAALMLLCGIGDNSAWPLIHEFFFRRFRNRREVGSAAGLCGMPYDSGDKTHEQGISKAGNGRIRYLMVELSWFWLRYQPKSAITIWFNAKFGAGGKRMRRVGIVAVARKLLVSLWRYLEYGEIPIGAKFKTVAKRAA
jgi:transposase